MLTLLFVILLFTVFGKLAFFAVRTTWSLTKFLVAVICLPVSLILIALGGLLPLALLALVLIGVVSAAACST